MKKILATAAVAAAALVSLAAGSSSVSMAGFSWDDKVAKPPKHHKVEAAAGARSLDSTRAVKLGFSWDD